MGSGAVLSTVMARPRRPDPPPLPYTGVTTVAVGTGLWLLALVALLPFWSSLEREGRLWWIPTCAIGALLGLLGVAYCRRRARALSAGG